MSIALRIGDYDNPDSLGSKFRRRRSAGLRNLIDAVFAEKREVSILDVGGRETYWHVFPLEYLIERNVHITLLNRAHEIQAVSRPDIWSIGQGDACELQFADREFDICHSNSVIEHVGDWPRKKAFAREVSRVATRYFHQTPNFWFPWEPHYGVPLYHWLPVPTRLWIAGRRDLGWSKKAATIGDGMDIVEMASLLNKRMVEFLFPDARIEEERFVGLTKSFIAVR